MAYRRRGGRGRRSRGTRRFGRRYGRRRGRRSRRVLVIGQRF